MGRAAYESLLGSEEILTRGAKTHQERAQRRAHGELAEDAEPVRECPVCGARALVRIPDLERIFNDANMSVAGVSAQDLAIKCAGCTFFFVNYGRNPREMDLPFDNYFKAAYIPMPRPPETDKDS